MALLRGDTALRAGLHGRLAVRAGLPGADTGGHLPGNQTHVPSDGPPLGQHAAQALDDASLLVGVPLAYLLPDPGLAPPESMQFFVVDPAWVRSLQRGMLGAATAVPLDDEELDALLDDLVHPGGTLTGFLLRSSVVERYPGLAVRAWAGQVGVDDDPEQAGATPVPLLRCERLTPGLLLVLFASVPDIVTIDEPPAMARLALVDGAVRLRSASGALVEVAGAPVPVPAVWRGDPADGVLDVSALAAGLAAAQTQHAAGGPAPTGPAGFALQLLRPPARQRYQRGVTR